MKKETLEKIVIGALVALVAVVIAATAVKAGREPVSDEFLIDASPSPKTIDTFDDVIKIDGNGSPEALGAVTLWFLDDTTLKPVDSTWAIEGIISGGGGAWSTTTSQTPGQLVVSTNNTDDVVAIGSNSSTTAEFWFDPTAGEFHVTSGATIDVDGVDADSGNDYEIAGTSVLDATTLGTGVINSSLTSTGVLAAASTTLFSATDTAYFGGTATTTIDSAGNILSIGNLDVGASGVRLSGDGDGAITFLGLGDGNDENLIWNFDDTANEVVITTGTGVSTTTFSSINLAAQYLAITGTAASSTFAGGINTNILSCTQALETDANGGIICGTDATGAGGGAFAWTVTTTYNEETSATSTPILLLDTLYASSTSFFTATSTWYGRLNVGTSTPHQAASLNIEIANAGDHGLKITGATSQTEHLLSLEDQAGTEIFTVEASGEIEGFHLATEDGDHTLHLETDTGNFADVIGIFSDYDAGTLAAGEDASNVLLTLDRRSTTGGDLHGILVITTAGSADATALEVGAGVNPIRQSSGTFGDMDECTDNGTDILSSCTSAASDVTIFDNDNDMFVIGDAAQFTSIDVDLATDSSKNVELTFEYSDGTNSWVFFTPTDGTNGFQDSSRIAWELSDVPTWATGTSTRFFIRLTRTRTGNIATPPVENLIQISNTSPFFWNLDGNTLTNLATTTRATTTDLHISGGLSISNDFISDFAGTGLTVTTGALNVDASQTQITALGTITTGTWDATTILVNAGGTGADTLTGILEGNGTSAFTANDSSTVGQVLRVTGSSEFAFGALDLGDSDAITGTLPIANGGTAATSLDDILGTTNEITVSAGANTIIGGNATLSFPSHLIFTRASTTLLSVTDTAYFGGTATSSFDSAGVLSLIGNLVFSNAATTTIVDANTYAWSIATSTGATPIFKIDTSATGVSGLATSTFTGGLDVLALNVTGTAASSTFAGGIVTNIANCTQALETDADGGIICGTDATGGSGSFAWTPTTNYNATANATNTPIWFQATPFSMFASTTAVFQQASTTFLTVTNDIYLEDRIIHQGDETTNIDFGTGSMLFNVGGTAFQISSTGYIVNPTNDNNFDFRIEAPGNNFALYMFNSTADSPRRGFIGVATDTPKTRFQVGSSTPDAITTTNEYNSAFISGGLEVDGTLFSNGSLEVGAAGVRLTGDGDGAITFLGLGNGTDENLIWNFDDTANEVVITTSTGVSTTTYTSIGIAADAFAATATSTLEGIQLTNIISCTQALETDGEGGIICGTDATAASAYPFTTIVGQAEATTSAMAIGSTTPLSAGAVLSVAATSTDTLLLLQLLNDTNVEVFTVDDDGLLTIDGNFVPKTTNGGSLGISGTEWSDLFLDDGSVINFNADVQLTHSSNLLTLAGGNLDLAANNIITGGIFDIDVDGTAVDAVGSLTLGLSADAGIFYTSGNEFHLETQGAGAGIIVLNSEGDAIAFEASDTEFARIDLTGLDIASGDTYQIAGTDVLSATVLGSGVLSSSLTSTGVLAAASTTLFSATDTAYFGGTATSTFDSAGVLTLATDLSVANGGTGASTFTDGGILFGSGTGAFSVSAVLANGELLIGDNSTDPVNATLTGTSNELTVTNGAGTITLSIPDTLFGGASFEVGRDADNNFNFGTDNQITFDVNAVASTLWSGTEYGFNITGVDIDFVWDGNTVNDLIFGNALIDRVGIGSTTPSSIFAVEGTSTVKTLNVDSGTAGTSTIYMRSSDLGGEIIVRDVDNGGCTSIAALNGVLISKIVTCPADPVAD